MRTFRLRRTSYNGDPALYADQGGHVHQRSSTRQPSDGWILGAFASLTKALKSGKFSDFENIIMGGTRTLNGPQGGLCFDLEGSGWCAVRAASGATRATNG